MFPIINKVKHTTPACRILIFNQYRCGSVQIRSTKLSHTCNLNLRTYSNTACKQSRSFSMASAQALAGATPQIYDFFLVLDFEATCENGKKMQPQEIIELPVLKVNSKTFETEAIFHQYVEPMVHKELTPFCTELTGIVQGMVDGQPDVHQTLKSLNMWMEREGLLNEDTKSIFVTCGDWDLKVMLPGQCKYFMIQPAVYFSQWINIKRSFSDVMSTWPKGMMPMLEKLGIKHEGRHHSGIDDCRNIAKILKALASKGYVFKATGQLQR